LLVPKRKRHFFATNSKHRPHKYPNKAKSLCLTKPEQLWVSDITYIKSKEGNMYLSLITDAFSRKIMGCHIADHLKANFAITTKMSRQKMNDFPETRPEEYDKR
jgi:putative transposase